MRPTASRSSLQHKMPDKIDISYYSSDIIRRHCPTTRSAMDPEIDGFRHLVLDLLTTQARSLSLLNTPGPDGALDFLGHSPSNARVIGTCKIQNNLASCKQALKYLEANVQEFLQISMSASEAACYENFRPWRDPAITEWWYCISYSFKTEKEKQTFKTLLEKTLGKLARESGLANLAKLCITVYDWQALRALLESHPTLYQKWVGSGANTSDVLLLPEVSKTGPTQFASPPQKTETLRYHDYLGQHTLPYISRDEYRASHPEASSLITETDILDHLLSDDKKFGCLIYGERGIGKTRLMREIGDRAQQAGWKISDILHELSQIKKLLKQFKPGTSFLLLLDNIEGTNFLDHEIFSSLQPWVQEGVVKMIINCRRTPNTLTPQEYTPSFWSIDLSISQSPIEQDYCHHVSQKILASEQTFIPKEDHFFKMRPAFAVFLHYIQTQFKKKYPDLPISGVTSFNQWLTSHLPLSFPGHDWNSLQGELKEVFYLFALLPTSPEVTAQLYKTHHALITPLKNDGWIEERVASGKRQKKKQAAGLWLNFEVIADEIIKARLDFCQATLTQEIQNIFSYAIQHHCFDSCFQAFERISDFPLLKNTPGIFYPLFTQLIAHHADQMGNGNAFILTSLLSEEEIVHLLAENPVFFTNLFNHGDFPFKISYLINFFARKKKRGETINGVTDWFLQILGQWFPAHPWYGEHAHACLRLLSTCLSLFGKDVILWEGGPVLEQLVRDSLRKHCTEKYCAFLIIAWLDTVGDYRQAQQTMGRWLNRFPTTPETGYVLASWLDARGDKDSIRNALKMWMNNFCNVFEASFLIRNWLEQGGDREVVKNGLQKWLELFGKQFEAYLPLTAWLKARGEKEWVLEAVRTWLKQYPLHPETSFTLNAWLEFGGDPTVIQPFILPWLEAFADRMEDTSFVLKSWLNCGGTAGAIEQFVFFWLDHYYQCYEATYVIEAWLINTNNLTAIQNQTFKWLRIYRDQKDADFVIKRVCRSRVIPDETMMDIIFWCRQYQDYDEVLFKLDNLVRNHLYNPLIADTWLLEILSHWIAKESPSRMDIGNLECIMFNLLRNNHFASGDPCTQLFIQWFNSPHSFREDCLPPKYNFLQIPRYFYRFHYLITRGKIDTQQHPGSLEKFLNWVYTWSPGTLEKISQHVQQLKERLPQSTAPHIE